MASYHLSVKTVKRSAGRTATAAAAYRAAERIACEREGKVHDYTRKQGIAESFILAPADAPHWSQDRAALWNSAEQAERRQNSVVAREWEIALPSDLSAPERAELARFFAQSLVDRYGVAADVAVHEPHRNGDQRNHHAHILTTTRVLGADGLGAKTRILDAAKTGGAEIENMRGFWAELQNRALERAGQEARVDHRSLEAQRELALDRGDDLAAAELDRPAEIKLGPAASAMEREAMREAERDGADYVPVTERGAQNHAIRQRRDFLAVLRQRAEMARDAYAQAREQDAGRIGAAVEAARALFSDPVNEGFAEGFEAVLQARDEAQRQAIEEERERERLRQLDENKGRLVEVAAQAWQKTWELDDPELAKEQQSGIAGDVRQAAVRLGVEFDDLAGPINERAREIDAERERQRQIELERERSRDRDSGLEL